MLNQKIKPTLLRSLTLERYRCFEHFSILLKDISIIVGKNNAGKSTLVEALRIVALAGRKSKISKFTSPSADINNRGAGIVLNLTGLKIDTNTVPYLYEYEENSIITAIFSNKTKIEIHISESTAFAYFFDDKVLLNKNTVKLHSFDTIAILPQISPIKETEKLLSNDTIEQDKDSYLASKHFRNELYLYKSQYYDHFKKLAEQSWSGLKIESLDLYENELKMYIVDGVSASEIGLNGSGIQMWLQVIWLVSRSCAHPTIILDEPDVYLHPDLQRKILIILKQIFPQIIIATHSVDIMSEVEARNIALVNKKNKKAEYANNAKGVQHIVDSIGSVYNLSLVRISMHKKCIFVEGKDIDILEKFHKKINPKANFSLKGLPWISLGSATRLNDAYGAAKLFNKESDGEIKTFCIIDKDYLFDTEIESKYIKAKENKLDLFIWSMKEIENYIIDTKAIYKLIYNKIKYDEFIKEFEKLIDHEFMEKVLIEIASHYQKNNHNYDLKTAHSAAQKKIKHEWKSLNSKIAMVGGKDLLRAINKWLKERFNTQCSLNKILNNIQPEDIHPEMRYVIEKLTQK